MTDHEIEYEVRIAACAPRRFSEIADKFYMATKADPKDKSLWHRFWSCCRNMLVEFEDGGPFTLLVANPKPERTSERKSLSDAPNESASSLTESEQTEVLPPNKSILDPEVSIFLKVRPSESSVANDCGDSGLDKEIESAGKGSERLSERKSPLPTPEGSHK